MQIGTDDAYATLAEAIRTSQTQTRSTIMQVLSSSHDERAAPLFVYILDHTDHRGPLEHVYRLAVESLGHVGGDARAIEALKKVLYRGEWWAPGRTKRLRTAAAMALRACDSPASQEILEAAAHDGPGSVRRAAKAALEAPAPRTPRRTN
jgi:HEAT repeat protein